MEKLSKKEKPKTLIEKPTSAEVLLVQEVESLRKELEKYKEEAETSKEELKRFHEFLSIMTHDLKSFFYNISGPIEILKDSWEDMSDEERTDFIVLLDDSTRKSYSFLEEAVIWLKVQKEGVNLNIGNLDLSENIKNVVSGCNPGALNKKVELVNKVEDKIIVFADPMILGAVIRNLISNAIKFTPEGGVITVYVTSEPDNKVKISVNDTGIGLSDEKKKSILNSMGVSTLGTNKENGTGFGLDLCISMSKSMGWDMNIEDGDDGKGAKFTLTLPSGK